MLVYMYAFYLGQWRSVEIHRKVTITLHTDISVAVEAKDFPKEKLLYLLKQKQQLWKYYRMG